MPSIRYARLPSVDASNISCYGQLDNDDTHNCSKSVLKPKREDTLDQLNRQQTSIIGDEKDISIKQEHCDTLQNDEKQISIRQNRFFSIDIIKDKQISKHKSTLLEQKRKSGKSKNISELVY